MKCIRIAYANNGDLERKCRAIVMSLTGWQDYAAVRARFAPNSCPQTFSMRLKRFTGTFPARYGPAGVKLLQLRVTPELAEHLASDQNGRPKKRKWTAAQRSAMMRNRQAASG